MEWMTTSLILDQLRDFEAEAWDTFTERFREPVQRFCKSIGLPPDDLDDVAQETLVACAQALRDDRFDRSKGKLRSFLFGIAYKQAQKAHHRRAKGLEKGAEDTQFWGTVPDEESARQTWDESWSRSRLEQCLRQVREEVRPHTFRAFEMTALESQSAADTARVLDMKENAVFQAKHRVLTRLRELKDSFDE